jgi:hypothetical protein
MPAFLYGGDTAAERTRHELWRVRIFTDQDCLNPVFPRRGHREPGVRPRRLGTQLAMPADVSGEETAWRAS